MLCVLQTRSVKRQSGDHTHYELSSEQRWKQIEVVTAGKFLSIDHVWVDSNGGVDLR